MNTIIEETNNKWVVYYYLGRFNNTLSASTLRPQKIKQHMKNTYKNNFFVISGNSRERKAKFRLLLNMVKPENISFIYIENLSAPHHRCFLRFWIFNIPYLRLSDWLNFFSLKYKGVPMGYFLRDIHWNFPYIYGTKLSQKDLLLIKFFGILEIYFLKFLSPTVFVPSLGFKNYIKSNWNLESIVLEPGSDLKVLDSSLSTKINNFELIYVGGTGPVYGSENLIQEFSLIENIVLNYCTRHEDWEQSGLGSKTPRNMRLYFPNQEELPELYSKSHIALLLIPPIGYAALCHPYKASEYIRAKLPIITYENSACSQLIKSLDIGWCIPYYKGSLKQFLDKLSDDEFQRVKLNLDSDVVQKYYTWDSVVQRIEKCLVQ